MIDLSLLIARYAGLSLELMRSGSVLQGCDGHRIERR